jgi:hypothetical protein
MDWRLLGLEVEPDEDLVQPLEIAAVVKGLDSAGHVSYWTVKTPAIMNAEVLGMMTWGADVALRADD